jgi:hypothetical protein
VSSPVRQASSSESLISFFGRLTALSFEFVATPERAAIAPKSLPAAIHSALEKVSGFAGSLVMVSDQEARLITVVVFCEACEARQSSTLCVRRVRALLAPYQDRCLRFQTMVAHMPAPRVFPAETDSAAVSFIIKENISQEDNVCVV